MKTWIKIFFLFSILAFFETCSIQSTLPYEREKFVSTETNDLNQLPSISVNIVRYVHRKNESDVDPQYLNFEDDQKRFIRYIQDYISHHGISLIGNEKNFTLVAYYDTHMYFSRFYRYPEEESSSFMSFPQIIELINIRMVLRDGGKILAETSIQERRVLFYSLKTIIFFPYYFYDMYGKSEECDEIAIQHAVKKLLLEIASTEFLR